MNPKVLAVDDDREFAELMRYNLEQQGWEILVAQNGTEALQLARSASPNVILLDLMLPDFDGLTVLQILRSQPSTRDIPVFLVSALDRSWAAQRTKAQFSNYFKKPIDLKLLNASMRDAIRQRQCQSKTLTRAEVQT